MRTATYRSRRAAGLCVSCGGAKDARGVRCQTCARANVESTKAIYRMRRELGLCWTCPAPARPGLAHCLACAKRKADEARARYHAQKGRAA